jgi:hypothetical protein
MQEGFPQMLQRDRVRRTKSYAPRFPMQNVNFT